MEIKMLEIRDRATFIPALAIRLGSRTEQERYLLARAGFGRAPEDHRTYVILMRWNTNRAEYDPFEWGDRTMRAAHHHLRGYWDSIKSGDVIDVEYIMGATSKPKVSESNGSPA